MAACDIETSIKITGKSAFSRIFLICRFIGAPPPKALDTIDVATGEAAKAINQRSDVCAVPAAGIVAEAMAALVLADAVLEKFGGDSVQETKRNFENYIKTLEIK